MVKNMNLKKSIRNKIGSYILEASIIIPAVVLAFVILLSIVPVIRVAGNSLFSMGDELKTAGMRAAFIKEPASLPLLTKSRLSKENSGVGNIHISNYGYLYEERGVKDLLSIGVSVNYSGINPMGSWSVFRINQRVMSRAFTGLDRSNDGGSDLESYEDSHVVYVFPRAGEKYHNRSCPFLNPACEKVFLTSSIKSKFNSCRHCKSSSASLGDQVFCFFNEGKVYHLGTCSSVDKYYVAMEKKEAEGKGYGPCMSCGG